MNENVGGNDRQQPDEPKQATPEKNEAAKGQQADAQGRNTIIMLNHEEGTFEVLNGKGPDGRIKTAPKNDANGPFSEVVQGDIVDNFVKNYYRQSNYPTGLKALWTPLDKVKEVTGKFLNNVKNGAKDLMEGIKNYEFRPRNGLAPEEVDWKKVEQLSGMKEEYLKKHGVGEAFEKGETSKMMYVNGSADDFKVRGTGTLSTTRNPDTMRPCYRYNGLCNEKILDLTFNGYSFTEKDKANLIEMGHMGQKAVLEKKNKDGTTEKYHALVSLNPDTKEPMGYRCSAIKPPNHTKGVKWDDAMKQDYVDGKVVTVEGCKGPYGEYTAHARFDAAKKGMDFKPLKTQKQGQQQDNKQGVGNEQGKDAQQKKASEKQGQGIGNDMKGKGQAQAGIKTEGPVKEALDNPQRKEEMKQATKTAAKAAVTRGRKM